MLQRSITIKIIGDDDTDIDAIEREVFEKIRDGSANGFGELYDGRFNYQVVDK